MQDFRDQDVMPVLLELLRDSAGIKVTESDWGASFFELGLDSLFLTQFSVSVGNRFGASLTFRQMSSELDNLNKLAAFLRATVARVRPSSPTASKASEADSLDHPKKPFPQGTAVERLPGRSKIADPLIQLFLGQLDVMQQQLKAVIEAVMPDPTYQTSSWDAEVALRRSPDYADTQPAPIKAAPLAAPDTRRPAQATGGPMRDALHPPVLDAACPPVPGARLGRDPSGKPAWFVPKADQPGKYMKLE